MLLKAAEYRSKANVTLDKTLQKGYLEIAADLEQEARKG
jgi:hypothetical protein